MRKRVFVSYGVRNGKKGTAVMYHLPLQVKVQGDLACFTRPSTKVERVSYEVITPSAARGVLEAIFWKPEFRWHIREIQVLQPIQYISFVRNEVKHRVAPRTVQMWSQRGGGYAATEDRTQRQTLALRDVAYILVADMVLRPDVHVDAAKYRDQFRRRVQHGQCFARPYLGCREFAATFEEPHDDERPLDITLHVGHMLFDIEYHPDKSGRGTPRFFDAHLQAGVLSVPQHLSETSGGLSGGQREERGAREEREEGVCFWNV
jgi:CRISPR-associated protein Cas5d